MNRRAWALAVATIALLPRAAVAAHFVHPTAGYALDYPDSWHVDQAMLDVQGPLFLNNFPAGQYLRGGHLPPHGIIIEVLPYPEATDVDMVLVPARASSSNVKRAAGGVAPLGTVRVDYDFAFDERTTYPTTSIALLAGGKLFILQMMYEQRTPTKEERDIGEAALSQIASSLSGH